MTERYYRSRAAVLARANSVTSAAATTLGSVLPLLGANLAPLRQFGVIFTMVTLISYGFTMGFFLALLMLAGPCSGEGGGCGAGGGESGGRADDGGGSAGEGGGSGSGSAGESGGEGLAVDSCDAEGKDRRHGTDDSSDYSFREPGEPLGVDA
jgi:hypothetical protein